MRRVVVTGMGLICPTGNTKEEFWQSLLSSKSGIDKLTKLRPSNYINHPLASEIKDLPETFDEFSDLKDYGLGTCYAAYAAKSALQDAGIYNHIPDINFYSVVIGTTLGNMDIVERATDMLQINSPDCEVTEDEALVLEKFNAFELSCRLASEFNFGGTVMTTPTACSAGNYALSVAYGLIKDGDSSVVLAGASDPFSRTNFNSFYSMKSMSPKDCRPFDENRTGLVVGEGAAVFVVEDLEHALQRGAKIYGEISGCGLSSDAFHPSMPDPSGTGAEASMRKALKQSNLKPGQISYISAHGTATKTNDSQEALAMQNVFGDGLKSIPVCAIKSSLGHCMGAASALEAVASLMSIEEQMIPPTISTEIIDKKFENNLTMILNAPVEVKVDHVLSNAFGFGGNNCCIIFSRI
jgi:3-oxoacyl-[acyl-carrier-protein] synthase II